MKLYIMTIFAFIGVFAVFGSNIFPFQEEDCGCPTKCPGLLQVKFIGAKENDFASPLETMGTFAPVAGAIMGYQFFSSATSGNPVSDPLYGGTYRWENNNTVFGYKGEMYLEGGKTYAFAKWFDDGAYIKIGSVIVLNHTTHTSFSCGTINIAETGWYPIEIRLSDGSGGKGPQGGNNDAGVLWAADFGIGYNDVGITAASPQANWKHLMDNGDGRLFRFNSSDCPVEVRGKYLSYGRMQYQNNMFSTKLMAKANISDAVVYACYGDVYGESDTNRWTLVEMGALSAHVETIDVSVALPIEARYLRFCAIAEGSAVWSRTIDIVHVREPAVESVREFNAAGSTEASFIVDVAEIGANAEKANVSIKYGTSKDALTMTKELGTITEPGVVSNSVTGLQMDTKYWWQVVIENNNGQSCSSDVRKLEIVRQWSYTVSNGEATVRGLPPDVPAELIIPEVINGYPVTTISLPAFAFRNSAVTRLVIPKSIERVTGTGYQFMFHSYVIDWFVSPALVIDDGSVDINQGAVNVYAYGEVPNNFPKDKVRDFWCTREVAGSWFANIGVSKFQGYLDSDDPDDERPLTVRVTSTTMRANDPTIMDVDYIVRSKKPKVKTRVLAYQDATKSFAKVVRPETFTAETRAFVGDDVTANETHRISWHVAADWNMDLATVAFEVLAREDELVPLELATVPATASHAAITYSWNGLTAEQILGALYWLYADGDPGLTLQNGYLKANGVTLASGNALSNAAKATEYVLGKMGYGVLSGDDLAYVNSVSGLNLAPSGVRQYAVKYPAPPASQEE